MLVAIQSTGVFSERSADKAVRAPNGTPPVSMAEGSMAFMTRTTLRPGLLFVSLAEIVFHHPIADLESLFVTDVAGASEVDADQHARGRILFRRVRDAVEGSRADGGKCR